MRIDKFLNAVNITKRRAVAEDMLAHRIVLVNGQVVKKAKEIKIGDIIQMNYIDRQESFKVLDIPKTKSTPKSKMADYVQLL